MRVYYDVERCCRPENKEKKEGDQSGRVRCPAEEDGYEDKRHEEWQPCDRPSNKESLRTGTFSPRIDHSQSEYGMTRRATKGNLEELKHGADNQNEYSRKDGHPLH